VEVEIGSKIKVIIVILFLILQSSTIRFTISKPFEIATFYNIVSFASSSYLNLFGMSSGVG